MKKSLFLVLALMLALFAGSALADADYTFDPANPYDGVMSGLFDEGSAGTSRPRRSYRIRESRTYRNGSRSRKA